MLIRNLLTLLSLFSLFAGARASDLPVEPDRLCIGFGQFGVFDGEHAPMGVLELRLARHWHGLHPWAGVGWATDGATYVCAGLLYPLRLAPALTLNIGGAPGY